MSEIPPPQSVTEKLDSFLSSNKIPHILFHGQSGTGKITIAKNFISAIYHGDRDKIKKNVMYVNCAHGKGIKFIREDLKFFAKLSQPISASLTSSFKSIVLLNADFLTIDAQSALRRCIELFSHNTRFFIVVENKHKLLNPILSRFCEIYVPETQMGGIPVNLHQYNLEKKYSVVENRTKNAEKIGKILQEITQTNAVILADISQKIYEQGLSCIDMMNWLENQTQFTEKEKSVFFVCFHKIKSEFRCEKLLLFFMLDFIFMRENKDLKNIQTL
jgi:DNA polymerase III delta prime subunit